MSAKWLTIDTLLGVGIGMLLDNITLGIGVALGTAPGLMQRSGDR